MAKIDKIKVQKVIKEKFHDQGKNATPYELSVAYMDEYPDFYHEFTMDEQMDEGMIDGAIAYKKIKQVVNDNIDVVLEQP